MNTCTCEIFGEHEESVPKSENNSFSPLLGIDVQNCHKCSYLNRILQVVSSADQNKQERKSQRDELINALIRRDGQELLSVLTSMSIPPHGPERFLLLLQR
jgi:hypothetical protein